ncbi:hypothetical protein AWC29_11170 [Mycobacterium triplex]|uniref:Uncharacterized protein n=1 Tax=Mycobacterium triplex TaxID=47839 RepID=A0A024JQ40_9MYCO|nr:hypothetical protein [Mycobacterium triplex]ORX05401.1 hypothetical protein AWC29_11170 [Mycobacterium triplex]CDO85701.1 hypothetical protein BN973_00032 [Mycobacterium triplex]
MRLSHVSLGAPAAERDIEKGLEEYFVESEAYRRVADRTKTIIIGNRGAGKSAIFQILAKKAKSQATIVIDLAPEDYSYELLQELMASEREGSWAKHGAYSVAWKYLIYVSVMKSIATNTSGVTKKSSLGAITRYIRDNHSGGQPSKLSSLISYLKRIEGVKIGKYEAALQTRELEKLYKLEEINNLLPALKEVLASKRVIVFVDELDRGWDASEDAQAFVAGLFQACLSINQLSTNLTVYMSLRQELYENIPALYEDAQKYRDLIEYIRWDEDGLRKLICARLRYSLVRRYPKNYWNPLPSDDFLWAQFFTDVLNYRQSKSFNYLVDRTLYRPREIIQFCSQVTDAAREAGQELPLGYGLISIAEPIYSEDRAKDIAAEFRLQYPDLLKVFEAFRGLPHTLDRETLEELCMELILQDRSASDSLRWLNEMEPHALIDVLWRIGFLRAQAVGGIKGHVRSGSTYLGAYQVATLNLSPIKRFQVHPMFRTYLGTREAKG